MSLKHPSIENLVYLNTPRTMRLYLFMNCENSLNIHVPADIFMPRLGSTPRFLIGPPEGLGSSPAEAQVFRPKTLSEEEPHKIQLSG